MLACKAAYDQNPRKNGDKMSVAIAANAYEMADAMLLESSKNIQ